MMGGDSDGELVEEMKKMKALMGRVERMLKARKGDGLGEGTNGNTMREKSEAQKINDIVLAGR